MSTKTATPKKRSNLPPNMTVSKTGVYGYRRRVPGALQETLGKSEIKESFGKDYTGAMKRYGELTAKVDKLFKQEPARRKSNIVTAINSKLQEFGITMADLPLSEDAEETEGLDTYLLDALEELSRDGIPNETLRQVSAGHTPVTLETALDDYCEFKKTGQPLADRKLEDKVELHKQRLKECLGAKVVETRALTRLRRQEVNQFVEALSKQMKPSSVQRYINDIRAAVERAIFEYDLNVRNPFVKLTIKGASGSRDDRPPLDEEDMAKLKYVMETDDDLGAIWLTLRDTGTRPKEAVNLRVRDFDQEGRTIWIRPHKGHALKTKNSEREIPIPDQLVKRLTVLTDEAPDDKDAPLFPRYGREGGHTACSAALMKRLRSVLSDKSKAVYGLRHRMKDALRDTDCPESLQREIMGHSGQSTADDYGRGSSIDRKRKALEKVWERTG